MYFFFIIIFILTYLDALVTCHLKCSNILHFTANKLKGGILVNLIIAESTNQVLLKKYSLPHQHWKPQK